MFEITIIVVQLTLIVLVGIFIITVITNFFNYLRKQSEIKSKATELQNEIATIKTNTQNTIDILSKKVIKIQSENETYTKMMKDQSLKVDIMLEEINSSMESIVGITLSITQKCEMVLCADDNDFTDIQKQNLANLIKHDTAMIIKYTERTKEQQNSQLKAMNNLFLSHSEKSAKAKEKSEEYQKELTVNEPSI